MGVLGALLGGVLVAVAVAEPAPDPAPHTLGEILTCQPDPPSLSLSVTLDGRGLFWFHFPSSRWLRGAPALPAWPEGLETPGQLLPESQMCREILGILGRQLAGLLPQARGIPVVSVFPAHPPSPGGATTLLCLVENIFPPSLTLTWTLGGVGVTHGVTQGPFVPTAGLTFVRTSRISVTARPGDVVACAVTTGRDNGTTVVAYWVAPDTALDEQLDMALAGAALALGLVLALLGLGLALLARRDAHAPFVLQVASWCSLATDGSLVATNGSQEVLVALSQMPLVCGDLRGPRAGPCQQGGPLGTLGAALARALAGDSRWGQRLRQRRRLCQELPGKVWPPLRAPPQLHIVPERSGPALALACHAWGFSPAEITLRWLRNGDIIGDTVGDIVGDTVGDTVGDASGQTRSLPVGDGTFWARVTLQVPPGSSGDTFECLALHPSLEEPLRVTWAPGLSPRLALLVALAVPALLLGLLLFAFGLGRYLRTGYSPLPGANHAGYTPLPGDTYAASEEPPRR
ncbi:unnamed protein product [Coccothraustes coccothraustes]